MTGDANAFDRFVEHFRAKIFHYSWLMCGQREDAEDVAQDTLLNVFESFDQLREPERVRPWVFRIARNACLMKRRKSVFAPVAGVVAGRFHASDATTRTAMRSFRSRIGPDCPIVRCCNPR